jgi:uncharacterized membrane protein HdeD (DUF308 family)
LVAFSRPGAMTLSLVLVFGVFAFVEGIAAIITAVGRAGSARWGMMLLEGILSVLVGAFAVLRPTMMAVVFLGLIAAWALVTGALQIATAFRLRKVIQHEWALGLTGALSIIFGVVALLRPVAGTLAVIWTLAFYALAFGILQIVLGFRLRTFAHAHPTMPHEELHQPG